MLRKRPLPSAEAGLAAVFGPDESVPRDPWGRPYIYEPADTPYGFDIVTYGADGLPGGTGDDADARLSDAAPNWPPVASSR